MNIAEIKSDNCSILATYFILKILSSMVDVCNMILNGCYKGSAHSSSPIILPTCFKCIPIFFNKGKKNRQVSKLI